MKKHLYHNPSPSLVAPLSKPAGHINIIIIININISTSTTIVLL
jgi:hypothetical protein